MEHDLWTYMGISPPDVFAGFCGGVVNFFWFRLKGPKEAISAVIVGALTANWLGVLAGIYFGATTGHVGAFLVGLFGLKLIGEIVKKVKPDFFLQSESE